MALDQAWRAWLLWLCCELSWNWSGYGPEGSLESNSCPEPRRAWFQKQKGCRRHPVLHVSASLLADAIASAYACRNEFGKRVWGCVPRSFKRSWRKAWGDSEMRTFLVHQDACPPIFWHQDVRAHFFPPRDHIKTPAHNTPTFKPHSS